MVTTTLSMIAALPERIRRRTTVGSTYRPEIDGLRFFAIMFVIIGHMTERIVRFQEQVSTPTAFDVSFFDVLAKPGSGVYLFFAISGFIIANQYLRKKPMPFDTAYLKSYFVRRLLRIEPPYFIVLIGTYIIITLTGFVPDGLHRFNEQPASLTTSLIASLFYVHSPYFGTFPRLFGPGWSLEIEVQFYILAPAIFCILYFVRNTLLRRIAELVLLVAGLWSASYWATVQSQPSAPIHLEHTLLLFFVFFWIGVVVASEQGPLRKLLANVPNSLIQIWPWLGVFAIFFADSLVHDNYLYSFTIQSTGILLSFFGVLDDRSSLKRFCSLPWISLLGGACYSIYLVHLQILQVASKMLIKFVHLESWLAVLTISTLVLVPLVLASGMFFYVLIERTFMIPNWPQEFRKFMQGYFRRAAA
jgi:peptidoglycan/LPS O-acetylase OafA/YrhL